MGLSVTYLLDTNILSEMAKREPCLAVAQLLQQRQFQCAVGAPTIEELSFGINRLPPSAKRDMLSLWLEEILNNFVLLPYDHHCGFWLGRERARLMAIGKTTPHTDGEIAAIAVVNELTLVTRNTADFQNFSALRIENWFVKSPAS
ncbi:MAG: type II toxin-antitoxin system VapC family toxin [Sulfurimicrobium sp.]|nr:type II toxin-antitoxin system VapC family toxin [Sulfurimicrobium sp.]